jgi:hypothetical protein
MGDGFVNTPLTPHVERSFEATAFTNPSRECCGEDTAAP